VQAVFANAGNQKIGAYQNNQRYPLTTDSATAGTKTGSLINSPINFNIIRRGADRRLRIDIGAGC